MKAFVCAASILCLYAVTFPTPAVSAEPALEKHASYLIDLDDLDGKSRLDDGDIIQVIESKGGPKPPFVEIRLRTHKKLWYKAILLFDKGKNNSFTKVCELTEAELNQISKQTLSIKDIQDKALVLTKAKALGVHSNVYQISDAATKMKAGHSYIFIWKED